MMSEAKKPVHRGWPRELSDPSRSFIADESDLSLPQM